MSEFAERFWSRVDIGGITDCWPWRGPVAAKGGHGKVKDQEGKQTTAHRLAYRLSGGIVRDGQVLAHQCDNPCCCNPRHLRATSQKENVHEMINRGRGNLQKKYGKRKDDNEEWRARKKARAPKRLSIPACFANSSIRRGPIINLCGPPGSGKTTLLKQFAEDREDIVCIFVDERRERFCGDTDMAWSSVIARCAEETKPVVIESSGLSVSLAKIKGMCHVQHRVFRTFIVEAEARICFERLGDRRYNILENVSYSVDSVVRDCLRKLPERYPDASLLLTTRKPLDEAQEAFNTKLDELLCPIFDG